MKLALSVSLSLLALTLSPTLATQSPTTTQAGHNHGLSLATTYAGNKVLVYAVAPAGAAEAAGLRAGDFILAIGGQAVHGYDDALLRLRSQEPLLLTVQRGSQMLQITLKPAGRDVI